ncbi:MAG: hypothetical protein ACLVB5_03815 [Christensenellales bacterium]
MRRPYIPDDVTIQVLVQAREHLIRKTFEAMRGAKMSLSISITPPPPSSARSCFKKDMDGIIDIAVDGAKLIARADRRAARKHGTNIRYRVLSGELLRHGNGQCRCHLRNR